MCSSDLGKWPAIALAALCWLLAAVTIPIGVVGLLSNFSDFVTIIGVTSMGG